MLEEAAICNYRGHVGFLLCVDWSPVDPDVIWTGGKDFTLHEWKVSTQEFTKPPKGEHLSRETNKSQPPTLSFWTLVKRTECNVHMLILSGKKMVNLKEKKKKNKKVSGAGGAGGAAPLEMNGGSVTGGVKAVKAQELSGEDEEDEVSSISSSVPPSGKRVVVIDSTKVRCVGPFLK